MAKRFTLKDPIREAHLFRTRAIAAAVLTTLLVFVLLARLVHLQVHNHDHFSTLSNNNRVAVQPIAPTRGLIFDRNGVVLAENLPTYILEVIPERVEDMETTLAALRKLVNVADSDLKRFRESVRRKRRFEAIPLRFQLTDEEVARVAVNRHRLPGVEINSRLTRHYPLGALTAHVVGYVGRINQRELNCLEQQRGCGFDWSDTSKELLQRSNYSATNRIGKVGVERSHEDALHGKVGFQKVETNARGRVLRILERTPPVPGKDLHLNIDIGLQQAAQKAFTGERGALVAIEPKTGAVLALVSVPSYDSNLFVNGIDSATYTKLSQSLFQPLFNRALRGQYPPGSTTKPFVGLAGLELGDIGPDDKQVCRGHYQLEGEERHYRDWTRHGPGVDVHRSIVESCDVFFYDLAHKLGIDRLSGFLRQFGFGQPTGVDIGGEAGGLMPTREWKRRTRHEAWYPGETLITGIGQGFTLATPLQMASTTAALAIRGQRMQPQVVRAVEHSGGGNRETLPAVALKPVSVKESSNWDRILNAMEQVVHGSRGTARRIGRDAPYQIAGKTGTAQVFGIAQDAEYVEADVVKLLRDHALFIGFAPVDEPQIAIGVIVENGGSGGAVAAPIARQVMDYHLIGRQEEKKP